MSEPIAVTDQSFETDVLKAPGPVLVDFWAEWCGPCKQIAPALHDAAEKYDGRLTVAKVDIDANPNTPNAYGVRGIPTLLIFRGGNVVASKIGALSKSALNSWIDSII